MKMKKVKFKSILDPDDGLWHVVSDIYEPAHAGFIGSGIYDCEGFKTKSAAEKYRKEKYASTQKVFER